MPWAECKMSSRSSVYDLENSSHAVTTAGDELMRVPSMSKRTDWTLMLMMCGSTAGVMVPLAGRAKEPRREPASEGGAVDVGVGIADMVKACLVKTDMVGAVW